MTFVFTESVDFASRAGYREGGGTKVFGPDRQVEGLRFNDGDKIYFIGAVRPEVESYVRRSIFMRNTQVAIVRQR